MSHSLPPIEPTKKTGQEQFHDNGNKLGFSVLDLWTWSFSDLVSNASRGIVAEFLVAKALDITTATTREEWDAYDLETSDGIKIEVKSSAYLQSWSQGKPTRVTFNIPRTRAWNPQSGTYSRVERRQADVYVFALLAHEEKATIDPLNVNQWEFYVLPTEVIESQLGEQKSVTLGRIRRLVKGKVSFGELAEAVRECSAASRGNH